VTLPDEELRTLLKAIRALWREASKAGMSQTEFAIDAKVSPSSMSMIIRYPKYKPGKYVQKELREFIKRVKQRCPQEVKEK